MKRVIILFTLITATVMLLGIQASAATPVHQAYYDTGSFSGELEYDAQSTSNSYDWLETNGNYTYAYKVIYTSRAPSYADALYDIKVELSGIEVYTRHGANCIIQGQEPGQTAWTTLASFNLYWYQYGEDDYRGGYSFTLAKGYKYIRVVVSDYDRTNYRSDEAWCSIDVGNMKLDVCRYIGASSADISAINDKLTALQSSLADVKQQTLQIANISNSIATLNSQIAEIYNEMASIKGFSSPLKVIRNNSINELVYGELVTGTKTFNNSDVELTVTSTSGYTEIKGKIKTTSNKYRLDLGGGNFLLFKVIDPPSANYSAKVSFGS